MVSFANRFYCGFRTALLLTAATAGAAQSVWADYNQTVTFKTPGFFMEEANWTYNRGLGFNDYSIHGMEKWNVNPAAVDTERVIHNQSGYDRLSFEVLNTYGCYVNAWLFYERGVRSGEPKFTKAGFPKLVTITYAEASVYSSTLDIIPLLKMINYRLDYNANGGSWSAQPVTAEICWSNQVTFAQASVISRVGYSYQGWNTVSNGTGVAIQSGLTCKGGEKLGIHAGNVDGNGHTNITLYAQWKPNKYKLQLKVGKGIASISYRVGSGSGSWTAVTTDTDVDVDCDATWQTYATAKAGYSYSATSAEKPVSGKMSTAGATFNPQADVTANKITVSFNGNGETKGTMSDKVFTYDEGAYLPKNEFERGYTVSYAANGGTSCEPEIATYPLKDRCWNNLQDGSGAYSYTQQQMVINPCNSTGAPVMLYAQWDTNSVIPVTLPSTGKDGGTFMGWFADSGLTEYIGKTGDKYTPTNNVKLYAKWEVKTYTVTFRDGHKDAGDALIESQQIAYQGSATPPTPPQHDYCEFSNWDKSYENITADVTIRAQYKDKVYQISYQSNYRNGLDEKTYLSTKCGPGEETDEIELKAAKSIGFAKLGYGFEGWDWNSVATTPEWHAGEKMTYVVIDARPGGKLYAIWSPNDYKVQFDGNGATGGSMPDQTFKYDAPQTLSANAFSRTDGQDFLGWATNDVDAAARRVAFTDGQMVSNLTTMANGIVTLKAVWSNYHYVRFDGNGATNAEAMAVQKLTGSEATNLTANTYGKKGYTFAGWASNLVDAASCRVAYTNCQSVSFPLAKPNETNDLFAVWSTNRYMIVFDPGTNGVDGAMDPLTNCLYDTQITLVCGYTNVCSLGLAGWSRKPGTSEKNVEYEATEDEEIGAYVATVSNLVDEADSTVKVYAVWKDIGDLSRAVGLTNAALYSTPYKDGNDVKMDCRTNSPSAGAPKWDIGHTPRVAWVIASGETSETTLQENPCALNGVFKGAGTLRFSWCFRSAATTCPMFKVFDGDESVTNLVEKKSDYKPNWDNPVVLKLSSPGPHRISWRFSGTLGSQDIIAIDDVSWTPGTELKPGYPMPTYASEAEAKAAAETVRVTPPNAEVAAVVSAEDYNAMFEVRAVPKTSPTTTQSPKLMSAESNAGEWTLVAELKPSVSNDVQLAVDAGMIELAANVTNVLVTVPVTMKPGLYYGLAAGAALSNRTVQVGKWVLGEKDKEKSVSADRPSDDSAFYSIRAQAEEPKNE